MDPRPAGGPGRMNKDEYKAVENPGQPSQVSGFNFLRSGKLEF